MNHHKIKSMYNTRSNGSEPVAMLHNVVGDFNICLTLLPSNCQHFNNNNNIARCLYFYNINSYLMNYA